MTAIKLKLMARAALIRMNAGEKLEDILTGWPALSEAERGEIRGAVENG